MGVTLTDVLLFGKAQLADVDNATLVIYRRNILRWSALGGYLDIIVRGVAPLSFPDAIANSLSYVKAFGGTGQNGTPTPTVPVDIVSNNGIIKFSPNEANYTADNVVLGYWLRNSDGQPEASSANFYTAMMPIKSNVSYVCFGRSKETNTISGYNRIAWYDANGVWIRNSTYTANTPGIDISPANAVFARFHCNINGAPVTQELVDSYNWVFQQGTAEVPYTPTGVYADGTVETISAHGKNLFDKNASYALFSGYLNNVVVGQNTILNAYNGGDKTIIIKVTPNTTYTVTRATNLGSVYDRIRCAAFTTLPVDRSQGVILYNYMSTTQASATFTTLSDTQYVAINVRNSGAVGDDWTQYVDAFQLELGSTATAYAPYYDGGTATTEMLLKVGDYTDVQEILSGAVTRNVGIKVFNGTEDWVANTVSSGRLVFYVTKVSIGSDSTVLPNGSPNIKCSHFETSTAAAQSLYGTVWAGGTAINFTAGDFCANLTAWRQWLAAQYAAGTPVIVIYPLATPTTESVTGQTLQVQDGDNTLEITQAGLTGLELEAGYEAAVTLSVQEAEDANLDDNVTVTIG